MVLALYVLAGVMMVGGLVSIYSGSDIIVMERGWTMVIAGSVFTACGALLIGIATAVARLHSLEGEFARLSDRFGRAQPPSFAPAQEAQAEKAPSGEGSNAPPVVAVPEIREHRDLDIVPEPILTVPPAPAAPPAPPAPAAPQPLPAKSDSMAREALAVVPDLDESIFERDEPAKEPAPPEADAAPPTIVGTYNSGGNFYVMYSDGSIEAETPAGKFRFDSLDELKEFIAAGGDKAKATS